MVISSYIDKTEKTPVFNASSSIARVFKFNTLDRLHFQNSSMLKFVIIVYSIQLEKYSSHIHRLSHVKGPLQREKVRDLW